ncbi:MAG: endonuclease/exonuclease/phosphatase family protein [Flavobacteriales bacterium]|nr:endonuclease/exonuclease/phosphatase family protein [Flavobacteriales bacterium]
MGEISVITYNIRHDCSESIFVKRKKCSDGDEQDLIERIKGIIRTLTTHNPDIVCIQEIDSKNLGLLDSLSIEYDYYSYNRVPNLIMWKKSLYTKIDSGFFPIKGQISTIDGKYKFQRTASWILLINKASNDIFLIFNSHFDPYDNQFKKESAEIIFDEAKKLNKDYNIIICGDFNSDLSTDSLSALKENFNTTSNREQTQSSCFNKQDGKMYDHIFWSRTLDSFHFEVIKEKRSNNRYSSDHLPVYAKLVKTHHITP